ncbi:MAG TPA: helix-turn-helix domain-containing protein, partial [Acidimicrobiales bacterium]
MTSANAFPDALPGDQHRRPEANVQVIARAAAILRSLGRAPQGRSLAELAAQVDLPRSTVHRLVKALEAEGFVSPVSASSGFRLGPGLLQIASVSREWVVAHVHPELVALSARLQETVDL